jgi:hypothetical protein
VRCCCCCSCASSTCETALNSSSSSFVAVTATPNTALCVRVRWASARHTHLNALLARLHRGLRRRHLLARRSLHLLCLLRQLLTPRLPRRLPLLLRRRSCRSLRLRRRQLRARCRRRVGSRCVRGGPDAVCCRLEGQQLV